MLQDEAATNSQSSLSRTAYADLLPVLWSLLSLSPQGSCPECGISCEAAGSVARVWSAVLEHCFGAPPTSRVKRLAVEFVASIILLQSDRQYIGPFRVGQSVVDEWMEGLPRLLWDIGSKDPSCTQLVLRVLLTVFHRKAVTESAVKKISTYLIPFWGIMHPRRGVILGPWAQLEATTRKTALEVAVLLTKSPNAVALGDAVDMALASIGDATEHESFWRSCR